MGHKYLFNTKHIKFNNSNIKHKIPFNYKTINKPSNNNIFSRVKFNKPRGISVRVIVFCLVSFSLSVSISFFLCPPKIRNIHQGSSRIVPLNCALLETLNLSLKNPAILAGTIPLLLQVSNLVIHPVLAHIAGVSIVRIVVSSTCSIMTRHGIVCPAQSLTDRGIHSWGSILTTADTPGNHTSLYIGVRVIFRGAHKGASSISFACVFAIDSSCTDEGIMELVLLSQPGGSQLILALIVAHNWEVNLLEDNLVLSCRTKLVLAPPSGKAGGSIKQFLSLRKTDCVNMTGEDYKVIVKIASIKLWANIESLNISVLMRVWLSLVLSVPLSTPDLQFCRGLSELVHTVPSSEDNSWSNERASALVEVHCLWPTSISTLLLYRLLMEDSAHVGPFTKLGLRLGESLDSYSKTILVPSSTFRSVLDLGRWWRNEVRIFTANIKEARAFAVFWSQTTKAIPDINKPCSISDSKVRTHILVIQCSQHNSQKLCSLQQLLCLLLVVLILGHNHWDTYYLTPG